MINANHNSNTFVYISIVLAALFVFVPSLNIISVTVYSVILFVFSVILFVFSIDKEYRISFSVENFSLLFFVFMCVSSMLYSHNIQTSFKYCVILCVAVILYSCLSNQNGWYTFFEKVLVIISLFNIVITILSSLNYTIFINIFGQILTKEALDFANYSVYYGNGYSGIMGQTGVNAFSIVPMIIIAFFKIKNGISVKLNVIYLVLAIWAIFLCNKRGAIIWVALSIIIVYFITDKKNNKAVFSRIVKFVSLISTIIISIIIAYNSIPFVTKVLDRFSLSSDIDVSTGRFGLYNDAIERVFENPYGIGIDAYSSLYGDNVHNEFLQLAVEIGVIGSLLFFVFFFVSLFKGIKYYLNCDIINDKSMEIYLSLMFYQLFSCFTSFPIHTYGFCIQVFLIFAAVKSISKEDYK